MILGSLTLALLLQAPGDGPGLPIQMTAEDRAALADFAAKINVSPGSNHPPQ